MRTTERHLTLKESLAFFPPGTSERKIRRWITRGCRGTRLAATKVGDRWYTDSAAVHDFISACRTHAATPTPHSNRKSHEDAVRLLKERFGCHV